MNPDGTQIRQLTHDPHGAGHPAWSPDGQQITFTSIFKDPLAKGEIYVMNADGTNPINLTQSLDRPDSSPLAWSPDGKQIVFTAAPVFEWQIWVMAAEGGRPRRLTREQGQNEGPDWSPDGEQIVFSSDRDGHWQIYMMNRPMGPINKNCILTDNFDIYVMEA